MPCTCKSLHVHKPHRRRTVVWDLSSCMHELFSQADLVSHEYIVFARDVVLSVVAANLVLKRDST